MSNTILNKTFYVICDEESFAKTGEFYKVVNIDSYYSVARKFILGEEGFLEGLYSFKNENELNLFKENNYDFFIISNTFNLDKTLSLKPITLNIVCETK